MPTTKRLPINPFFLLAEPIFRGIPPFQEPPYSPLTVQITRYVLIFPLVQESRGLFCERQCFLFNGPRVLTGCGGLRDTRDDGGEDDECGEEVRIEVGAAVGLGRGGAIGGGTVRGLLAPVPALPVFPGGVAEG